MTRVKSQKSLGQSFFYKFVYFFGICIFVSSSFAQDNDPPADAVPPPLKTISKDEKKLLEAEGDIKKRVKLSLELMDARILKAEKLKNEDNFNEALTELAGFQALLDNTLNFLIRNDNGGDKIDRRFITFEIYLRKQIPRLEILRREMPSRYGYHVGIIMKGLREARAKAVEPLFSDTVVPNKKPNEN